MITEGDVVVDESGIRHDVVAVFPHRRELDGELIGWIAMTAGDEFVSIDRLHRAGPSFDSLDKAESHLEQVGLSMLATPWRLVKEDGTSIAVGIVELTETRVVVAPLVYSGSPYVAKAVDATRRIELELPAGNLLAE